MYRYVVRIKYNHARRDEFIPGFDSQGQPSTSPVEADANRYGGEVAAYRAARNAENALNWSDTSARRIDYCSAHVELVK